MEIEKHRPTLLLMHRRDLLRHEVEENKQDYPGTLQTGGTTIPLAYVFDPAKPDDGVTATIPLAALNQIPEAPFESLVPCLLREKIIALMKSMPKALRVKFIPVPENADRVLAALRLSGQSLLDQLATQLGKISGEPMDRNAFALADLPPYLLMNFRVVDETSEVVTTSRDLNAIRLKLGLQARRTFAQHQTGEFHRDNITSWDFGDLPDHVEIHKNATTLIGYPAIVDAGKSVSLRLVDNAETARAETRSGVRRLLAVQLQNEVVWLDRKLSDIDRMCLNYATIGSSDELKSDLIDAIIDRALFPEDADVRTREEFLKRAQHAWRNLATAFAEIGGRVGDILEKYQSLNLESIQRRAPPALIASYEDMRGHLRELIYSSFITETPPAWLIHYPRYLAALESRLRKVHSAGLSRDQGAMYEIYPLFKQYHERRTQHRQLAIVDAELDQYWWMLQELRRFPFRPGIKNVDPHLAKAPGSTVAKGKTMIRVAWVSTHVEFKTRSHCG